MAEPYSDWTLHSRCDMSPLLFARAQKPELINLPTPGIQLQYRDLELTL